jgi:alkanesulfonate monooxygenase SsuD/methylene tetrahydromethanopterin reductase-like flavin-dependent oxidoreductase (luciferase family)
MRVGVMVTNYNQQDWPRLLAADYAREPDISDLAIHTETMKLGELVEPLGYDDIWCAEHYGSAYSMQGNPLQWLAFWAGRTRRIGVGTAVIVLPWANPVKLIHEIAILDLLLEGRPMHLGIGRGISKHEYDAFGVPSAESRERFVEMVEILRKSEELRFSYDGKHYQLPEMTVRPMARHRGTLFEKMKGAFNTPQSMVLAAELGLGQMFVTGAPLQVMAGQVAKFNAIRATKGLAPNQPSVMMYLHCAKDKAEIEKGHRYAAEQMEAARNHYAVWNGPDFSKMPGYEVYAKVFNQSGAAPEPGSQIHEDGHLIGTPEQILEKISRVQHMLSLEYLVVHPAHGSKPGAEARASLELFAEEVLPHVHKMATPLHEHSLGTEEALKLEGAVGAAAG